MVVYLAPSRSQDFLAERAVVPAPGPAFPNPRITKAGRLAEIRPSEPPSVVTGLPE